MTTIEDELVRRLGRPGQSLEDLVSEGDLADQIRWHEVTSPEGDRLWRLVWQAPVVGDPEASWCLSASVGREAGGVWVIVRLGLVANGFRMRPVQIDVEPPPLVFGIVDRLPAEEDGRPLIAEPWYATDHESARHLADLLLDRDRVMPVVVVSSAGRGRGANGPRGADAATAAATPAPAPLVDADAIARSLVGIAHVVVLDSVSASFALTDLVGAHLAVFGGAVRVYWPGMATTDEGRCHPLWLPRALTDSGPANVRRALVHAIMPVALARFSPARLAAKIRAAEDLARRNEIAQLWARARDASLAPEWQDELERAWTELEGLRRENAELTAELATAHENLRAMAATGTRAEVVGDGAGAAEARGSVGSILVAEPRTVVEALEVAAERCEHLVFLDDAYESARRATYRQPGRLLEALIALSEVVDAWREETLDGGFRNALARRGFDYGHSTSPSTVGRYPHEYERTYDGRRITLGPHLRLGRGSPQACCRIYLYLDEARKLCVVGHVGNHLSDRTTG